jgi:hypothetical protein
MGLDVYSRIVLGFRVEQAVQEVEYESRGCDHELASPEQKFCAECGKKAWNSKMYNALSEPEFIHYDNIFQSNADEEAYYVGLVRTRRFTEGELRTLDIEAVKKQYGDLLTQEGIDVADCEFGLYLAVYYSY